MMSGPLVIISILQIFILPLICAESSSPYRLNVPRLLLPYTPKGAQHVTFTLEAQAGCYTWSSTHRDVASVAAGSDDEVASARGCSSTAVVRSESLSPGFRSTTIVAREADIGHELRCIVDVGSVREIEIITVRREVYVDEAPVKMMVRALDSKGNRFSRLTGFVFEWTLTKAVEAEGMMDPHAIARFETFDESQYEGEDLNLQLERKGLRGDEVLLEGLNVGIVRVNARLVNPAWQSVPAAVSDLLVVENLHLVPPVVYIMPAAYVDYSVLKLTLTSESVLDMPCEQYELRITNSTVGRLDRSRSRVTGLQLGSTLLQLGMPNMPLVSEHYRKDADLFVVMPAYLQINVDTGVWVLEAGRLYEITVSVLDKDNNPMVVTDNMKLVTDVSSSFDVLFESVNGSYFHVRATQVGRTTLKSTLNGVQNLDTGELVKLITPVHRNQPAEIFDRLDLQPDILVLPWHPERMFHYSFAMTVVGGSGQFRWACPETSVARIDGQGVLTSAGQGVARPKVTDAKNNLHFDVSTVHVIPPVEMRFVPSPVEAEVGKFIDVPLSILGRIQGRDTLVPFGRCHRVPLQWSFSEDDVFEIDESYETNFDAIPKPACVALRIRALRAGFTELHAVYEADDLHLAATLVVAGYDPLKLVNPSEDALVALGSSWTYTFAGGPLPWILDTSQYYENGEGSKVGQVGVSSSGRDGVEHHQLRVVCQGLGHHAFNVHVGNSPTENNVFPANSSSSARVICATPSKLELLPEVREDLIKTCPWFKEKAGDFPVLFERPLGLVGRAYNQLGHQFHNFSSLDLNWVSDHVDVVNYVGKADHSQGKVVLHRSSFTQKPVKAKLTLSSAQYNSHILQAERVAPQAPFPAELKTSLKIQLSSSPRLDPPSITVFNHPDNKMDIKIFGGSGFFSVKDDVTSSVRPARLTYNSKKDSHLVEVLPQAGGLTSAEVRDQCLDVDAMRTSIRILDGNNIDLTVASMVMVDKHIVAAVRVLDTHGEAFDLEQYKHMNLRSVLIGPFISATPAGTDRAPKTVLPLPDGMQPNSLLYVIEGIQEGDAQLLFNATLRSNRVITSDAAKIQVYSPLKIEPRVVRLVPTAHYQVRVTGGPRPQLGVTFRIDDETIATCDASGVVTAHVVGETKLTGHAQSSMHGSGILTEDTVHIIVVKLTGIKIFAPSTRVLSTTETSVYAKGLAGETPVVFGTAQPPITFHWQASDDNVFQLQSVYRRAAATLGADLPFSVRLLARSAGDSTIRLRAECGASLACDPIGAVFNDQLRVNVVEKLHIVRPVTVTNSSMLMRPRSSSTIVTNRAGHCLVTYQLLSACGKDCASSVVTVSSDGSLTSGGLSGTAFVLITAHEHSSFNQTLVLQVEVKPMASVTIHSYTAARAVVGKRHALPLGLYARFSVTLQDDLGRVMDSSSTQFIYRLTRTDVAHLQAGVENGTFHLRAAKEGSAVMQVTAAGGQMTIEDFINVYVGIGILPADPVLHVGTKVCFTSHLSGENDEAGYWSSSNPSVLSVEAATGLAHALSIGHSTITYLAGGTELALVEVTVTQVAAVSFDLYSAPSVTNALNTPMSQISVPVNFTTSLDSNDGRFSLFPGPTSSDQCSAKAVSRSGSVHTVTQQVPFTCVLSSGDKYHEQAWLASAFSVESKFDSKTGESYCSIKALGDAPATQWSQPLHLTVQVTDAFSTYSVESTPASVSFIAGFSLNTDQFSLADNQPPSHVIVKGTAMQLTAIKASSSEPSLVTVERVHSSQPEDGRLSYRLSIAETASQFSTVRKVTVDFVSSLTGQRQAVAVTYTPPSETRSAATVALEAEVAPTACSPQEPSAVGRHEPASQAPVQPRQPGPLGFLADERNTPFIIFLAFIFTILAIIIAAYCLSPSASPLSSSMHYSPNSSPSGRDGFGRWGSHHSPYTSNGDHYEPVTPPAFPPSSPPLGHHQQHYPSSTDSSYSGHLFPQPRRTPH